MLMGENQKDFNKILFIIISVPLGILLLTVAFLSLYWKMEHDVPLMFYNALLIEHFGKIPYKDFLDLNMPGCYIFYIVIGKLSGYSDFGIRLFDILTVAVLSLFTYFTMRKIDKRAAVLAVIIFALHYFGAKPYLSLQRDYFSLIFLAAFVCFFVNFKGSAVIKYIVCGVLLGVCVTIKPHAVIFIAAFLIYAMLTDRGNKLRIAFSVIAGSVLPVGAALLYLTLTGSLGAFIDMAVNYLPLYGSLSRTHYAIVPEERLGYLYLEFIQFNGHPLWILSAFAGLYFILFRSSISMEQRKTIYFFFMLMCVGAVYVLLPGQFFGHHWLMFFYFAFMFSAMCIISLPANVRKGERWVPVLALVFAMVMNVRAHPGFIAQLTGEDISGMYGERINEITSYLKSNLREGDKIQPLEWTGGALHSMLLTRADLGTRFIYDQYLYHSLSSPYIQSLRSRFLTEFRQNKPGFVVRIYTQRAFPSGPGTAAEFPELEEILKNDYTAELNGNGYKVYKRK
jgi:hypothetical protein